MRRRDLDSLLTVLTSDRRRRSTKRGLSLRRRQRRSALMYSCRTFRTHWPNTLWPLLRSPPIARRKWRTAWTINASLAFP